MRKMTKKSKQIISILLAALLLIQAACPGTIYASNVSVASEAQETETTTEKTEASKEKQQTSESIQQEKASDAESEKEQKAEAEASDPAVAESSVASTETTADKKDAQTEAGENAEADTAAKVQTADTETADQASDTALTLGENESRTLDLTEDTTLPSISMADGSKLTVNTNGYKFTVTGDITGTGEILLKGKNIHIQNLSAKKLTIENAEIDAAETSDSTSSENKICVTDELTIKNSKISNAGLLGYAENVKGSRKLTFSGNGNELNKIQAVGTTQEGNAEVALVGVSTISSMTNVNFVWDYTLTYKEDKDTELTKEADWPSSYRVSYTGSMANAGKRIGYHKTGTDADEPEYVKEATVTLPEYATAGYTAKGWQTGTDQEVWTTLPESVFGDLTLYAVMEASPVTIIMDCGYEPDATTNDNYENLTQKTSCEGQWGESVDLDTPTRFGYTFNGWKVVTEQNNGKVYTGTYTPQVDDAKVDDIGAYSITLKAQWSAKSFPIRFMVQGASEANLKVKVGDMEYASLTAFADAYTGILWESAASQLLFPDIQYGESIQAYVERIGLKAVPTLVDTRAASEKGEFRGWTTPGGQLLTEDMAYVIGGILDNKPAETTLAAYENVITTTPVFLTSVWTTTAYTLTVDQADGWDVLINGEEQNSEETSADGKQVFSVLSGSEVTFRCSAVSPKNFSLWEFTEDFQPEETKYTSGAKYLSYTALMPYHDVTATYGSADSNYVDLSQGSVTFAQNVTLPSGRSVDGFWYPVDMQGKVYTTSSGTEIQVNAMTPLFQAGADAGEHANEYFYIWDSQEALRITTCNQETQNQLILTQTQNVILNDCKLIATAAYAAAVSGTTLNGIDLEAGMVGGDTGDKKIAEFEEKDMPWSTYGNIVMNTERHHMYDVKLSLEGDQNFISNITTDGFHDAQEYKGSVTIQGISGRRSVAIGTIFGDFIPTIDNVALTSDTTSEYLVYTSNTGAPVFSNCTVDAGEKRVFTFGRDIRVKDATDFTVKELKCYYEGVNFSGTTKAHILGDIYTNRHSVNMSGDSSVVVEGNILTTAQDNYSSGKISTTGYLVVKGTVFDAASLTFEKGTVVCNIFQVGSSCTISGSAVLVANMITSNVYNWVNYEKGQYVPAATEYSGNVTYVSKADANEDNYPFAVYSGSVSSTKTYAFQGNARIYLLGYYQINGGYYDLTVKATDGNNPVNKYVTECLSNGNISTTELENVDASTRKNAECMLLGNSTYTSSTSKPRYISFAGASVYAQGNISLFNETTVSDGTIKCAGSFGTKADLTITGGTVNADTVGNIYNLTSVYADASRRWEMTTISGGTVTANTVGARDSYGTKSVPSYSLVSITGGTVNAGKICSDLYVNYIYDTEVFQTPDTTVDTVRLTKNGTNAAWSAKAVTLADPQQKDNTSGGWVYGSLSGCKITGIDAAGNVLPQVADEENVSVTAQERLKLYAVKSQYVLTKVYGNPSVSVRYNGTDQTLNFTTAAMTDIADLQTRNVEQSSIPSGAQVTLTVADGEIGKTVVWYTDANGQYHNALAGCNWVDNRITFTMQNADCAVYVVGEDQALPLDLSKNSLAFTKDGFITEFATAGGNGGLQATSEENVFSYSGDYKIVQSNIGTDDIKVTESSTYPHLDLVADKRTSNRLHFAADFDNTGNDGQRIIVSRVFQQCQDAEFGTVIESGAKVRMTVDKKVAFFRFLLPESAAFTLQGVDPTEDILYFNRAETNSPNTYLTTAGNNDGAAGDFTLENLTLDFRNGYGGFVMRANDKYKSGSLTMKNCKINKNWMDSTGLARNINKVTLDGCDFELRNNTGYTTALFDGCVNVTICNGSKIQWLRIGSTSTGGFPLDYGIDETLTIDNATILTTYDPQSPAGTYLQNAAEKTQAKNVILRNGASYTAESLAFFNKLQIESNASLDVKANTTEETWLLCKDIQVDGGTLTSDNVIVSGFYNPQVYTQNAYSAQNKAALDTRIQNQTNVVNGNDYNGLVLKSGTVNAKKFVGGDWNAKVEVSGGELNTPALGTSGYLYGFIRQLPANKTDYVYRYSILDYSKYTQAATVTVKGQGTVNITENGYIGGMRCTLDMQGGTVNLGDKAVVGMTESQKSTLENYYSSRGDSVKNYTNNNCTVKISGGDIQLASNATAGISVPYGQVEISGTAGVKVSNLQAPYGTVKISGTSERFENPYKGGESSTYRKDKIGVLVVDTLSAQTVEITAGAQVYAENAYAEVAQEDGSYKGVLRVQEAGLYAASYGEKGILRADSDKQYNDTANASNQTVFGTRMVSVAYELNPQGVLSAADMADLVNDNVSNYTATATGTTIALKDAVCRGYYFKGWYTNAETTGEKVDSLNTSITNNLTLYAKWEKIKVKFQVVMDADSSTYYNEAEFTGNSAWTADTSGNAYVSNKVTEIAYGDKILSVAGINLLEYATNTLGVTAVAIDESTYTGTKNVVVNSTVTRDLAECYRALAEKDADAVIRLHVTNVQKRIATITFHANRTGGKPSDAAFENGALTLSANVGVDKTLGSVSAFADTTVTDGKSIGLKKLTAAGYTFIGWNLNQKATKETDNGWVTKESQFAANTDVYAVWQVNTYLIEFNAGEGSWVTKGNTAPTVGQTAQKSLTYYWVYDTPVTAENSFWMQEETSKEPMTEMPYAWREGYVFDHAAGWTYTYTENDETKTATVASTEALSQLVVKALDVAVGDPNGSPTRVALTFTASYTPVKVTYMLNGGKWTGENAVSDTPSYGDALAGYVQDSSAATDSVTDTLAKTTDDNGQTYYVASTKATAYATNKAYADTDYRNTLQRKGYTFYGWYSSQEDAENAVSGNGNVTSIGTTPRFENVTLYAAWKANGYTLDIKAKDATKNYNYTTFKHENASTTVEVTVGQKIADDKWPTRDSDSAWMITDSADEEKGKRYFLGATFAALNPGATAPDDGAPVYKRYAETLNVLQNSGMLYQNAAADEANDSTFWLPEDEAYNQSINLTGEKISIPDYPNGSTIPMYAAYRAQSLVFVERYLDENGNEKQEIKATEDWNTRSTYPDSYSNQTILNQGYSLVGWFVNTMNASEDSRYPATDAAYESKLSEFKKDAETKGTYDIMVYTVYTTQIKRTVSLDANSDPTSNQYTVSTYTLPASMQEGNITLSLQNPAVTGEKTLQLVSKEKMEAHAYDSRWEENGTTYTADATAAIEITVSANGKTVTTDMSAISNSVFNELKVGAGAQIAFTLYHSHVMTARNSYSLELDVGFTDGSEQNTLAYQKIQNIVQVNLQPSIYTVDYTLQLPEAPDNLTVQTVNGKENWGDFSKPTDKTDGKWIIRKTVKAGYGSTLCAWPELEGYTAGGWKVSEDETAYTKLDMPVSSTNKGSIALQGAYTAKTYTLTADSDVLSHWKITYTDGVDGVQEKELTAVSGLLDTQKTQASVTVSYHSKISFTPLNTEEAVVPEFVALTLTSPSWVQNPAAAVETTLPEYVKAPEGNVYTFQMPDYTIAASYVTTRTMYLDEGSIAITEDGYTQQRADGSVTKTWRGDYEILQNAQNTAGKATGNTLSLTGDLSERTVALGNLWISEKDSIQLLAGEGDKTTKAKITLSYNGARSAVTAKNIAVPYGTELTLQGASGKASVDLSPATADAAIGGTSGQSGSGTLQLDKLDLHLDMPAGSAAAGVGPATINAESAGDITLTDSTVTVTEGSSAVVYTGVWIGGRKVAKTSIQNSVIQRANTNNMVGPLITAGQTVEITDSTVGTADSPVYDPVYAGTTLQISGSKLYMNLQNTISNKAVSSMLYVNNGEINVEKSTVKVTKSGNLAEMKALYNGKLWIKDTASDVTIDGTQIVETTNGDVTVNGNAYTQNTDASHGVDASRKNYRFLASDTASQTSPNLTITAMPEQGYVEIGDGTSNVNVQLAYLSLQTDTDLRLLDQLTVTGKAEIKNNAKVQVTANDGVELKFTGSDAIFAAAGAYVQKGGSLTSTAAFGCGSLDITLDNVTATAASVVAYMLNVKDSNVTAAAQDGKIGSQPSKGETTKVVLENATLTAATVGALGEYDSTFTKVEMDAASTCNGTLVQDHYRIVYDTSGKMLDTTALPHTLRTETKDGGVTVQPANGILTAPNSPDVQKFACWFINSKATTGSVRKALVSSESELPAGLTEKVGLTAQTTSEVATEDVTHSNDDGTDTLQVHAWYTPEGTVSIVNGRKFVADSSSNATSVSIPVNGAWTLQLTSTGTTVADRDYALTFSESLPTGTALTLTVPSASDDGVAAYYYYKVKDSNTTTVKFSDFTVMGGTAKFKSAAVAATAPTQESFLLAADFAGAENAGIDSVKVTFGLLPSTDSSNTVSLGEVNYSCNAVTKGSITATQNGVNIATAPAGDESLKGQKVFLKAEIQSTDNKKLAYGINAKLDTTEGSWISQDTVLFELGTYGSMASGEYKCSFDGLANGTYKIGWSLVYGASETGNIAGNVISNVDTVPYTENHTQPSLTVTALTASHVIKPGDTVAFTYKVAGDGNVAVSVEKQTALGAFTKQDSNVRVDTATNGKADVKFATSIPEGIYRICFSMNDTYVNDDVYYTVIVEK